MTTVVTLTADAMRAEAINGKHREVVALGRTAKETAAEIGELLIAVREDKPEGGLRKWVEDNCQFTRKRAYEYIAVAEAKCHSWVTFDRCSSIREVLAIGKPKPAPKPDTRAATLDDLRKVERLRALRDNPAATGWWTDNLSDQIPRLEAGKCVVIQLG